MAGGCAGALRWRKDRLGFESQVTSVILGKLSHPPLNLRLWCIKVRVYYSSHKVVEWFVRLCV